MRGAIVKGKLHHDDVSLVGEGLVRAYELESKVAVFPRVLVDVGGELDKKILDNVYRDSTDNRLILNPYCYLSGYAGKYLEGVAKTIPDLVFEDGKKIRDVLIKGLKHDDPRVREKYVWASRQFNKLVCDPFKDEVEGWFEPILE